MARLIDDILIQKRVIQPWFVAPHLEDKWAVHAHRIASLLATQPPVILIDNVADYYFAADQEMWSLDRDFPNLAPPFPSFWCEHRLPQKIHSKQCGDSDLQISHGRVGVLLLAVSPEQVTGEGWPEETRWCLVAELFIDYGSQGGIQGPHGTMMLAVDSEGRALDAPWMQGYHRTEDNEIMKSFFTWLHPMLLAVSFLHCKNVRVVENPVDKPLAKRFRERHGFAPSPHKTLIIEPLKQILRTEGRAGEVGLAKAMHICRGHFKDYREGRGLFGKYHQIVWQPSVVRGSQKRGDAPAREIEVKV